MIRDRIRILIMLLLLAGLAMLQTPASAGYWEVEYTSTGGWQTYWDQVIHSTPLTTEPYTEQGPFSYIDITEVHEGWDLPVLGCQWSRTTATLGEPATYVDMSASGTITPRLRWVPGYENEAPPDKVWVKLATAISWRTVNEYGATSSLMNNYFEDTYSADNRISDEYGYPWIQNSASSYGVFYTELDGSSGFVSVPLPLSLDVTSGGFVRDWYYCIYAYAYAIENAPPLPLRHYGPPWRTAAPHYSFVPGFQQSAGATQHGGDPVDLATGAHLYLPDADLTAYNPYGPAAPYQRNYLSLRAEEGYSSPGLSAGWVDNYDVRIIASFTEDGDKVSLVWPNGAEDLLYGGGGVAVSSVSSRQQADAAKLMDEEDPPIELWAPYGAPYFVTSVASQTPKRWDSITVTFKDQTSWTFTTTDGTTYFLSQLANRIGRYISINRDANNGNRLLSVTDDSSPANELLTFHYSGNSLSYVSDAYGRRVSYTFGSDAGTTCLLSVSQIAPAGSGSSTPFETYGYRAIAGHPHMISISSPSPTGSGQRTETINYDDASLMVTSLVDANGNQSVFTYDGYNGKTKVQLKDLQGVVVKEWTERYCGDYSAGTQYPNRTRTTISYDGTGLPSTVEDPGGKTTDVTHDSFGNVLTITYPRGTETVYTYIYPGDPEYVYPDNSRATTYFPLGRLVSIQQGTRSPTYFYYDEPSGLVHEIIAPRPGTVGTTDTVTTSYTYDDLGNVLTVTAPGNNAAATITTTYNYTQDGTYTQSAKLGQPLTVTDNLGHTKHYRYDARGNVVHTEDAVGNATDSVYNIADQLVTVVYPPTP